MDAFYKKSHRSTPWSVQFGKQNILAHIISRLYPNSILVQHFDEMEFFKLPDEKKTIDVFLISN